MSTSRETDERYGKRIEHFDDKGNKIGESRKSELPWPWDEIVHTDNNGNKIGTSSISENGETIEHKNRSGDKIGESQEDKDILGNIYIEHIDKKGNRIGESRKVKDILGNEYTEHSGEWLPYSNKDRDKSNTSTDSKENISYTDNVECYSSDIDYHYETTKSNTEKKKNSPHTSNLFWAEIFGLIRLSKLEKYFYRLTYLSAQETKDYRIAACFAEKAGDIRDAIKNYIFDGSIISMIEANEVATKHNQQKEALYLFERYGKLWEAASLADSLGMIDKAIELYERAGICSENKCKNKEGYKKACDLAEQNGQLKLALEIAKRGTRYKPEPFTTAYVVYEYLLEEIDIIKNKLT